MIEVARRGHGLCLDCRKDFKVCLCTYEGERERAAEQYSERQFKNATSFSVMKDVCNDEIYVEGFAQGCDWGRKWTEQIEYYKSYVLESKFDQLHSVQQAKTEELQKYHDTVLTLETALNKIMHMCGGEDKRGLLCIDALNELERLKKKTVFIDWK